MERMRSRASGHLRTNHVPASVGPRLQTGDLLRISGADYVVAGLRKNKAVVRSFCSPGAKDFTVPFEYALAMRKKPPRRLPNTATLLTLLRMGQGPITSAIIASAAGESHLDAVDRSGQTALIIAAARGETATVLVLLRHGADVHAHGSDGEAPLHKAAAHGHGACVAALLAHGAADAVDALSILGGCSALHLAAAGGHTGTVRRLLAARASVELCARGCSSKGVPLDAMGTALTHGHLQTAAVLAGHAACGVTWAYAKWGLHLRPLPGERKQQLGAAEWLHARAHFCTPLHCLEGMRTERAIELLRAGADLHATTSRDYGGTGGLPMAMAATPLHGLPLAPSPLDVARALLTGARPAAGDDGHGGGCHCQLPQSLQDWRRRAAAAGLSSVGYAGRDEAGEGDEGGGSMGEDERSGRAAARLVVLASLPWRPINHPTFPDAERERAVSLLLVGHWLAKTHGGAAAHALVEVWVDLIMPQVVKRHRHPAAATHTAVHVS